LPKRCVFRDRLKESKERPGRRSPGGRSFHSRGPAAEKLLSWDEQLPSLGVEYGEGKLYRRFRQVSRRPSFILLGSVYAASFMSDRVYTLTPLNSTDRHRSHRYVSWQERRLTMSYPSQSTPWRRPWLRTFLIFINLAYRCSRGLSSAVRSRH